MEVIIIRGIRDNVPRFSTILYYLQMDNGKLYIISKIPKRKRLTRKTANYTKLGEIIYSKPGLIEYWSKHLSDMSVSEYIIK